MSRLDFLFNRLMRMSPGEIFFRVAQKGQILAENGIYEGYAFDTEVLDGNCSLFSTELELEDVQGLLQKADRILEHSFDLFALKDFYIGEGIDYHKDYKSGATAPKDAFGRTIDYRDSHSLGDIKYIWEPNRQLYLPVLALAYKSTGDERYLAKFRYLLEAWFEQNPFMKGVNWASSLELGIRLINWTVCWHLLNTHLEEGLKKRWLDSVYRHCWFIDRNFSGFSSANNHRIGEAAGLYIASVAMPRFKPSKRWAKKARSILIGEALKQNYEDGVNKEQALSYQQFVLDFLILSGLAGEANNDSFPGNYWFTVEKMLVYLASIEDNKGNFPQIGDEDDGFVVDFMQREYGIYRSLLNTGAYLFKRGEFLKASRNIDLKTRLLLAMKKGPAEEVKPVRKTLPVSFREGGYYILGSSLNTVKEQKLIFDCGSLGYLSLAAHGHADALSIYFSAGGYPIFIDPGTYAYHADRKWRNYFRSTGAHNTVRVDAKDQSEMAGNFMWSQKAKARLAGYVPLRKVKGAHDGYERLEDQVSHEREIEYMEDKNLWVIRDGIRCRDRHTVELFFHLHPDCRIEEGPEDLKIYFEKGCCRLKKDGAAGLQIHRGEEEPPMGWYSPSYDVKYPTNTIRFYREINGFATIETRFAVEFDQ